MKRIKAYLLFTSWRYKLGIFLGLPAAALAGALLWRHFKVEKGLDFLVAAGIIFVEILADQGVFNGIHSRRGYKLDFLKTSPQGTGILFYGLTGDMVRRLLTAVICIGAGWVAKALAAESGWAGCLGMALAIYVAEALGIFISRFTRSVVLSVLIAYGCIAVSLSLLVLIGVLSAWGLWIMDGLLVSEAVAETILVVRTGMKKWRQTYYDMHEQGKYESKTFKY